jgi:hypothetical protein
MKKTTGVLAALLSCASCNKDYSAYRAATGKVSYVYGAHQCGAPGYRVMYRPSGSDNIFTVDGYLEADTYKKGDSVQIFYNPGDPMADVTDQEYIPGWLPGM